MKILKPLKFPSERTNKKRKRRKPINKKGLLFIFFKKNKGGKKRKERNKEIKRRKNFIPSLVLAVFFWIATFYIIFFIDPLKQGSVQLFFFSIFLSLLFTFSLLFANKKRVFLVTLSIIFFLILRYLGIGNLINIILISGLIITSEIYSFKK